MSKPFKLVSYLILFAILTFTVYLVLPITGSSNIEEKLKKMMSDEKMFAVGDLFEKSSVVCVLPYYIASASISPYLSKNQKNQLSNQIDRNIGDTHWWFVEIRANDILNVAKMSGSIIPIFKKARCIPGKVGVVSYVRKGAYYVYFNFYEGS